MKPQSHEPRDHTLRFTRRDALRIFASQMAVAVAGCSKPAEEIVPYVKMPEELTPGEPLRFATALPSGGYGLGILAISIDGRPIKVEGNPRHPASLGATDAFAEASIMTLYDPWRSKAVRGPQGLSSWNAFLSAWIAQRAQENSSRGSGLRILTGRITSPTLV